jgi:hypothetical protein
VRARFRIERSSGSEPGEEAVPVRVVAGQDHRERGDLPGLDEGDGLEELVERSVAAGQDHERLRVLHEHDLADEEVAERDHAVEVRVRLLVREVDADADGLPARLVDPLAHRLHRARSPAGDDGVAGHGEPAAQLLRLAVGGVLGARARRAEHGDRPRDPGQGLEALHELRHDAKDPPRVFGREVARRLVQASLLQ